MLRINITYRQMSVTCVYRLQRCTYNVGYMTVPAYAVIISSWSVRLHFFIWVVTCTLRDTCSYGKSRVVPCIVVYPHHQISCNLHSNHVHLSWRNRVVHVYRQLNENQKLQG